MSQREYDKVEIGRLICQLGIRECVPRVVRPEALCQILKLRVGCVVLPDLADPCHGPLSSLHRPALEHEPRLGDKRRLFFV